MTDHDLKQIMQAMQEVVRPIYSRLDNIETDLKTVKLRQEQEIIPNIQKLADAHLMLAEKVDRIETKVDAMQEDISLMKPIIISQRDELQEHDRVIKVLKSIN